MRTIATGRFVPATQNREAVVVCPEGKHVRVSGYRHASTGPLMNVVQDADGTLHLTPAADQDQE